MFPTIVIGRCSTSKNSDLMAVGDQALAESTAKEARPAHQNNVQPCVSHQLNVPGPQHSNETESASPLQTD
jgi:hypothetical protein